FFSHVIAMGLSCLCALAYIAGARYRDPLGLVRRALPYTAPIPLIVVWFTQTASDVAGVADAPVVYGPIGTRLAYLISQPSGSDDVSYLAIAVTAAIVLLPLLCGSRFTSRPARWLPLAAVIATYFAMPSYVFLSGFVYERLGVFLVPMWLLVFDRPTAPRQRLEWVAMAVVLAWVGANTWRFAAFAAETRQFGEALRHSGVPALRELVSGRAAGCRRFQLRGLPDGRTKARYRPASSDRRAGGASRPVR